MSDTTYTDARWAGTLAAITAALALYGFAVNADGTVVLADATKNTPGIVGVAGGRVTTLDGISYVAPRSTSAIPTPTGLTDPGPQHMAAFAGVWAEISNPPTTLSLDQFQQRFTDAERAAMALAISGDPALGVPLANATAAGAVDLGNPALAAWLGEFPAGTFGAGRVAAITTP